MASLRYYLLLDHVQIQGANAISGPLTYGFPAITGFLGAIHALSRNIESEHEIYLDGVMIACHECDVQVYRPHDFADYTFKLTRNPVGKDGKTRSIIEEGKVHLNVSLVVEVVCSREALDDDEKLQAFEAQIKQKLMTQRIAGGSVLSVRSVKLYDNYKSIQTIRDRLLPAFVLVNAQHELQSITQELQQQEPSATMLDALIETAKLHYHPQEDGQWQVESIKKGRGWLVPVAIGYQSISPVFSAGEVANTRSNQFDTQYVEPIYSLAKWVFPYRLSDTFEQAFWRYQPAVLQSNGADIYLTYQEYNDD